MPYPNKGKLAMKHQHRCRHCGKGFSCYAPLCPGRRDCNRNSCKEKR